MVSAFDWLTLFAAYGAALGAVLWYVATQP